MAAEHLVEETTPDAEDPLRDALTEAEEHVSVAAAEINTGNKDGGIKAQSDVIAALEKALAAAEAGAEAELGSGDGLSDDGFGDDGFGDDGFGDESAGTDTCTPEEGWVQIGRDCDDTEPAAFPGAVEICDYVDNDCDGSIDEAGAAGAETWYPDGDGDGFGSDGVAIESCLPPDGYGIGNEDCDDDDPEVYPDAEEECTELIDRDCDGAIGFVDLDGDGVAACDDCDDLDAATYPDADEYCDGIDNDCDGDIDEDLIRPCNTACESGYETCVDGDWGSCTAKQPETEICDGFDNDCDGAVDEGLDCGSSVCFLHRVDALVKLWT